MATIEDFAKLDLIIIKVLEASKMEGSDKLLRLLVQEGFDESGNTKTRQILSGIGKSYQPEDLVGRHLIAITNLTPRMMMGEESQGMILATGDELDKIVLIQPEKEVAVGSKIR